MVKKLAILTLSLIALNASDSNVTQKLIQAPISVETVNLEANITEIKQENQIALKEDRFTDDIAINLEQNLTKNTTSEIYIEVKEPKISFNGGKSFKSKFIVKNKFIKSKELIKDLDKAISSKFQSTKSPDTILNYEVYKFSVEENHGKFWVNALLDYRLTDAQSGEPVKTERILERYKSDFDDSGDVYKDALDKVAQSIYNGAFKQTSKHIDDIKDEKLNNEIVRQNATGGVVLPF
ncbi:MAG: hypothetical protein GXZ15_04940 [Campylobacter sp.]|nr:hypothetical protein [Campylobacter sp.]